jgi:hypothetical protein
MLAKIAQEMINEQKITGGIVRKTLSRGLVLTLTDYKLSLTREGIAPSLTEERIILEAFGLPVCGRREWQKGKYFVISFLYFIGESEAEKAWAARLRKIIDEPMTETLIFGDNGRVRLVSSALRQGELFSVATGVGYYE